MQCWTIVVKWRNLILAPSCYINTMQRSLSSFLRFHFLVKYVNINTIRQRFDYMFSFRSASTTDLRSWVRCLVFSPFDDTEAEGSLNVCRNILFWVKYDIAVLYIWYATYLPSRSWVGLMRQKQDWSCVASTVGSAAANPPALVWYSYSPTHQSGIV